MSVQPVADQYEDDTTSETTDVGFTLAGGEVRTAGIARKI